MKMITYDEHVFAANPSRWPKLLFDRPCSFANQAEAKASALRNAA